MMIGYVTLLFLGRCKVPREMRRVQDQIGMWYAVNIELQEIVISQLVRLVRHSVLREFYEMGSKYPR